MDSKEEQAIDSKRRLFIKLNNSECEKAIENIEKEEQIRGRRKLITQVLETSATLKNTETKVRIKRTRSRVSRHASSESSPPQLRRKLLRDDNATPKKVTRGESPTTARQNL